MHEEDHVVFRRFDAAFLRAGLVVGVVVLAAGCSQQKYWYQAGKTFDECNADHEDCRTELRQRALVRHQSSYPRRFMKDYMRQKGYELVAEKDLPLTVKREDPSPVSSDIPWIRFYGVAGAIPTQYSSVPSDNGSAGPVALVHRD